MSDDNQNSESDSNSIIIKPDFSLKEEVGGNLNEIIDESKVQTAEKKVEETISEEKDNYIEKALADIESLKAVCAKISKKEGELAHNIKELTSTSLAIKENAGLYGYMLAGKVASSLYILSVKLEEVDDKTSTILGAYTNVLEIIFKQNITDQESDTAKALLTEFYKISGTAADA